MNGLIQRLLNEEGKLSLQLIEAKEFADLAKDNAFSEFIENKLTDINLVNYLISEKLNPKLLRIFKILMFKLYIISTL